MTDPANGQEGNGSGDQTSLVNPDGSFVDNWHGKYGKENEGHLSRYKNLDALVNSHIATKKKFGRDPDTLVEIPTETSSDEVKAAWAKAHGVPEEYEYALSDEMAVKLGPLNDKKMEALREFGKSKNWSQADFKDVLDFYHKNISDDLDSYEITNNEQLVEAQEKGKAELRKEKGWQSEGEYNNKVFLANALMRKYGGEEAVASFNAQNSPTMAKFLNNMVGAMSEDTLKGLGPSTVQLSADIDSQMADVRSQMDAIIKENPFNFKINSKFKDLKKKKTELYVLKHKK